LGNDFLLWEGNRRSGVALAVRYRLQCYAVLELSICSAP